MANYKFYKKSTGEILSEHNGHPHDKDPLTKERQEELLLNMYEEDYYDMGIIVSEGHNAVFFPDVIEKKTEGKFVKLDKIQK